MKGFHGAGVLEVVEDYSGDAYRTVYTVQFSEAVYVLHAFQKNSVVNLTLCLCKMEIMRRVTYKVMLLCLECVMLLLCTFCHIFFLFLIRC